MTASFVLTVALMCACAPGGADGTVVKAEMEFDTARRIMADAGFEEAVLAVASDDGSLLRSWVVGEGVLVVGYRREDKIVTNVTYLLRDGRAKAEREEFWLTVKEYDVKTGEMTIVVPRRSADKR